MTDPTMLAARVLAELDPCTELLSPPHGGRPATADPSLAREGSDLTPNQQADTGKRGTPPNLPASFYDERPELAQIRDAAYSRARSADAVLGVTLARLATLTPPTLRLPAPVDSEATLDTAVALIGSSGSGKSGAARVARPLLPIDADDLRELPLGSYEGLVESYLTLVEEVDHAGKTQRVKRQTVRGILFELDEGQALADMGARKGSTLLPGIRSAAHGQRLGQANASEERRRHLAPGEYRFALVAGFQREHATALLDDAAGGTPQRFLYFAAEDAAIPDNAPPWPGPLNWRPPVHRAGPMGLDTGVATEIRRRALARARGTQAIDTLDAHRDLNRLKVAGLLALLAGRTGITADDWRLAGQVLDASDRVRSGIIEAAQWRAADNERTRTAKLARQAAHLDHDATTRAVDTMGAAIARHVHRGRCDGGCRRRCVSQVTSGKHRKLATIDDALDAAVGHGWIVVDGADIRPGETPP